MSNFITKQEILKKYDIKKHQLDICMAKRHKFKLEPFVKKGEKNTLLIDKDAFREWMEKYYEIYF